MQICNHVSVVVVLHYGNKKIKKKKKVYFLSRTEISLSLPPHQFPPLMMILAGLTRRAWSEELKKRCRFRLSCDSRLEILKLILLNI